MKHDKALSALKKAQTKEDFFKACREIVDNADHVRIDNDVIVAYADSIRKPDFIPNWHDYLSEQVTQPNSPDYIKDKGTRLKRAMIEFAINCSINSGYTYEGEDGKTLKWEINGSGAAALRAKLDEMWDKNSVPGISYFGSDIEITLQQIFADVPAFSKERVAILSEFTNAAWDKVSDAMERAKTGEDHYIFNFEDLPLLGKLSPLGFMEDPFRKKVSLLSILFASYASGEGVSTELDIPVPADYRVPQTMHNIGMIHLSDDCVDGIENGRLFEENAQEVTEMRAATVIIAEQLLQMARKRLEKEESGFRLEMNHLDGEFWFAGRLFDKPMEDLDEKKQKIRKAYEAFGKKSKFSEPGFMQCTGKAINVSTMRF